MRYFNVFNNMLFCFTNRMFESRTFCAYSSWFYVFALVCEFIESVIDTQLNGGKWEWGRIWSVWVSNLIQLLTPEIQFNASSVTWEWAKSRIPYATAPSIHNGTVFFKRNTQLIRMGYVYGIIFRRNNHTFDNRSIYCYILNIDKI